MCTRDPVLPVPAPGRGSEGESASNTAQATSVTCDTFPTDCLWKQITALCQNFLTLAVKYVLETVGTAALPAEEWEQYANCNINTSPIRFFY